MCGEVLPVSGFVKILDGAVTNVNTRHLMVFVLCLSATLRLLALDKPRAVIYDEVLYSQDAASYCCGGEVEFDLHPPLAKLPIAAMVRLWNPHAAPKIVIVGDKYDAEFPVTAFRLLPALA